MQILQKIEVDTKSEPTVAMFTFSGGASQEGESYGDSKCDKHIRKGKLNDVIIIFIYPKIKHIKSVQFKLNVIGVHKNLFTTR